MIRLDSEEMSAAINCLNIVRILLQNTYDRCGTTGRGFAWMVHLKQSNT